MCLAMTHVMTDVFFMKSQGVQSYKSLEDAITSQTQIICSCGRDLVSYPCEVYIK